MKRRSALLFALFFLALAAGAQHSVARQWNEQLLGAISGDFARPPVHARNLFHVSAAMYDAWAAYEPTAGTYFLGKTVHGFEVPFRPTAAPGDKKKAQEEAVSFAAYRMILHRYANSPGFDTLRRNIDKLMGKLGYNIHEESTNYVCGPAELGNYVAQKIIEYGLQDGSNEAGNYANQFYQPVNPPMRPEFSGNSGVVDINRWQPLRFATFVDQSGHSTSDFVTKFQSAEWGSVLPFAMTEADSRTFMRDGHEYKAYHDPGPPPRLDTVDATSAESAEFKWNMALVAAWGGLLDPTDGVKIDISPASFGNNKDYPTDLAGYHNFYDFFEGGDSSSGRPLNPKTGQPYVPQIVPRGDWARVLAEFWADGPLSVTPPGHWFEILNYVDDQPGSTRKFRGAGPDLDELEWDVKSYFALGGAMHDAAVAAWGIKGCYDAGRPVTAIRAMATRGQSSDPAKPHFHPAGLPLIPGYIELISAGDPLQGGNGQHINKIKLRSWRGPTAITDPKKDVAGVGWLRAENWYPYQRPTFVTPPFAGYVSGHSTYSRAAAELLTALTGDPYFPGGMGTFFCKKNEYLVFEDGPSQDITLQWATYRDASDQCSLSRIFGGIHPPFDDIPGRLIGMKIGPAALDFAEKIFADASPVPPVEEVTAFPNPTSCAIQIELPGQGAVPVKIWSADGRLVLSEKLDFTFGRVVVDLSWLPSGVYVIRGEDAAGKRVFEKEVVRL